MMIQAVLLYGSKARRDHIGESDTDLLGISAAGKIEKIYEDHGVSFHVYPFPWMSENALRGSLFLLHIARESIALFDPRDMLGEIKTRFRYKESYREEIQVGARILIAVDDLTMDGFSDRIRSRFFWGLRTAIMALAADKRTPLFSAESLEKFLKLKV